MEARIKKLVYKDSYLKEWRLHTAVCLMAIGCSVSFIEGALTNNLTNSAIKAYSQENDIDYNSLKSILK